MKLVSYYLEIKYSLGFDQSSFMTPDPLVMRLLRYLSRA